MTRFIALLRAVNVGGTGKLAMSALRAECEAAGFNRVSTYIQSGNALFDSDGAEREVKDALERRLAVKMGAPVGVIVRSADELAAVYASTPFADRDPRRSYVVFYDEPLAPDALDGVATPGGEELRRGVRELYLYYPVGLGTSKLKVPHAKKGTARNHNTVAKLVELSRG